MERPVTCYREYAPHPALRGRIRALFSFGPTPNDPRLARRVTRTVTFGPGTSYSATFADGDGSLVLELGRLVQADGSWQDDGTHAGASVIGAMSGAGAEHGVELPEMVGAYFGAAQLPAFTGVPGRVLADRIVSLEELWGDEARGLAERVRDAGLAARLELLDAVLLERLAPSAPGPSLDLRGLAEWVLAQGGRLSVERLAEEAGVSRQQLTRVFHERVGVSPKRYCRIARFQSALGFAAAAGPVDWGRVAADAGYADQSHLIAEFREFSRLTPHRLASERPSTPSSNAARSIPAPESAGDPSTGP
jgi:AraC-like DNA-binding protein